MCVIMSDCVGDGEGVETGELEGKEMEGKKKSVKNRNRQIEGRRAAGADMEGGWLGVFYARIQELPTKQGLKRWRESNRNDMVYISLSEHCFCRAFFLWKSLQQSYCLCILNYMSHPFLCVY